MRLRSVLFVLIVLVLSLPHSSYSQRPAPTRQPAATASRPSASPVSYWGMSAYLTKFERVDAYGTYDNLGLLTSLTAAAGATWTQEELSWALIEPHNADLRGIYDATLLRNTQNGLNTLGMLITTPDWARDPSCAGNYFCPPSDMLQWSEWVTWMTERYDGDGVADAPGSPRIAAWQIWNEPNYPEQLPLPDANARKMRYGQMLVAAYQAIKAADPTAIVVLGGVYVFDGTNPDGFWFLSPVDGVFGLVPQARNAFDVLGIHPYMPTIAPDSPSVVALVSLEGRLRTTRAWLDSAGRADAGIWITEIGWCTVNTSACPGVSEAQQAQYVIRAMVIAQQLGVQHTSWFQLENAFDGMPGDHPWGGAALLNNYNPSTDSYAPKPGYLAYQTLAKTLTSAAPAGTGPVHSHAYPGNPYTTLGGGVYDYRYTRAGTVIDVGWVPSGVTSVNFPVIAGKEVQVLTRNGQAISLPITNGVMQINFSEDPLIIIQRDPANLTVAPTQLPLLARPGQVVQAQIMLGDTSTDASLAWQASESADWLSLSKLSGNTPDTLTIAAQAAASPGLQTATIQLSSSGGNVAISVRLRVTNTIYPVYLPLMRR